MRSAQYFAETEKLSNFDIILREDKGKRGGHLIQRLFVSQPSPEALRYGTRYHAITQFYLNKTVF